MTLMFHQSAVRLRAPMVEDRYKNLKPDWADPDRLTVSAVNVQPANRSSSSEDTVDRQVSVTEWDLQTPQGVDIDLLATDRLEVDGMVLEVVGEVARWPDPFGPGVHHVEARLKRVS